MRSQRPPGIKGRKAPILFKLQGAWSQMRVRTPSAYPRLAPNCLCRDEYGQVKSVKLLRRGRRLQQAEYVHFPSRESTSGGYVVLNPTPALSSRAVFGKVKAGEEDDSLLTGPSPPPNVTPMPTPAFFESLFWRRFQLQRAFHSLPSH